MGKVKQKHELSVCALQRSGHHAVMEWLRSMLALKYGKESVVFMNWINEYRNTLDPFNNDPGKAQQPREALIYNFEDCGLYMPTASSKFVHRIVGSSEKRFNVLIIRDVYNLLASRMERTRKQNKPFTHPYNLFIQLWIEHAKAAVNAETGVGSIFDVIKYNNWFESEDYRKHVSKHLELPYCDDTLDTISQAGEGSSFIGIHGTARKLDVLSRWKNYRSDEEYIQLVHSAETANLNQDLFGWHLVLSDGVLVMKCGEVTGEY
jgi:hypothetical protein